MQLGADGRVLDQRGSKAGILSITGGAFEATLRQLLNGWCRESPPILMCGMIGSRQGWLEVPYVACPAGAAAVAGAIQGLDTDLGPTAIVPGIMCRPGLPDCDIMRGEETQLFGAVAAADTGLVIAPGTHSKWVRVESGCVAAFSTHMTGELYELLKTHSILGRLMSAGEFDEDLYVQGVARSLRDPALARTLFGVRTEGLFGSIAGAALPAYLSGILIGAEVSNGLQEHGPCGGATLVGAAALLPRYARALHMAGVAEVRCIDGVAASARGLWNLWRLHEGKR